MSETPEPTPEQPPAQPAAAQPPPEVSSTEPPAESSAAAAPAKRTPAKRAPAKKAPAKAAAEAATPGEATPPVKRAPAKRTPAKKAAPAAAAAAPSTPDAEAPAVPATTAPATEVPAAQAPETEAPETEAPETEAPEAKAPKTEVPVIEAPAAETPGTATAIPAPAAAPAAEQAAPLPVAPPVAVGARTAPPAYHGIPQGYAQPGYPQRPVLVRRPAPPGFLQTRWPAPASPASIAALVGILVGGLGFALFLPPDRPGLGWPVAGLLAALAVGYAAFRSDAEVSTWDRIMRAVWGVAAIVLLSFSAIRSSGLLTFWCVLAAIGCASLAAAGGRSLRALLFGVVAAPIAGFRSLPWIASGLSALGAARRSRAEAAAGGGDEAKAAMLARSQRRGRLVLSVVITLILLVVFGALFASADAVFAHYLGAFFGRIGDLLPNLDAGNIILRLFLLGVGLLMTAGGVYLATRPPNLSGMESQAKSTLGRDLLVLPLGGLLLLFIGFVAVQFTALFGGNDYVLKHSQINYSAYAVSGFKQLVAVAILTLIVVGVAARWGRKESPGDRLALRVLLGGLCALSIVIVVSALTRLQLYVDTYGLTRMRFAVAMLELFLAAMFALVLLSGIRMKAPWLPQAVLGVGVVILIGACVMNPERYIAQHNIDRYKAGEKIDLYYLSALTADAVPALVNLPDDPRNCVLGRLRSDLRDNPDEWYQWNWARENARQVLADQFPNGLGKCTGRRPYDYSSR